jgi:hypothetical protein
MNHWAAAANAPRRRSPFRSKRRRVPSAKSAQRAPEIASIAALAGRGKKTGVGPTILALPK